MIVYYAMRHDVDGAGGGFGSSTTVVRNAGGGAMKGVSEKCEKRAI